MCLMLTVRGGWIHKIWFIPAGWVVCHAFNILRIFIITLCVEFHPTWFYMLHDILFKYLFYGLMFAMWALFVEKIRGPIPVTNEQ
jgi:exosortase/archaeosortase family protein